MVNNHPDILTSSNMATDQARKILSIDGCGFRGRTQLLILDRLMEQSAPGKKPCEVFDLICGTAAGGLIAILLGRLHMTCKDAIKAYDDMEQTLFGTVTLDDISKMTRGFDTTAFQKSLEQYIGNKTLFMDPNNNIPCKTFVTVMDANAFDDVDPHILRSYDKKKSRHLQRPVRGSDSAAIPGHKWKTLEAAIGSISCPRLFDPLTINSGLVSPLFQAANASGFANPSIVAYIEALDLWGTDAVLTLVSLGMGIRDRTDTRDANWHNINPLSEKTLDDRLIALGVAVANSAKNERLRDFIRQTKRVATNTQVKHIRLDERMETSGPHHKYYRFDPISDERALALIDYDAKLKQAIEDTAKTFVKDNSQLRKAADELKVNHGLVVRIPRAVRVGGDGGVRFDGRHSTLGARLTAINVWTKFESVSAIELEYEFRGRAFSTGRYGGFGGTKNTLKLNPGEYVYRVDGLAGQVIVQLRFFVRTYDSIKQNVTYGKSSTASILNPFNIIKTVSNLQASLQSLLSGSSTSFSMDVGNEAFVGLGWFEGASGELIDSLKPCFIRQDCVIRT
ncbi:acyl transferase/acyl hydrolase/lysophospholipase [Collybia nuda]|uniref:Acyl transferase/acyl hydrolase/lysophospholipase n=1 Tax=Collybia nuda TaxID=64659 RepID=A0A9P5YFI0_9AGAR|nr:acyl transferase/acyl hydrolase/lysophospholipase [Collybia nuda]